MSSGKLNATGQRWVNQLADFHFTLHYKPGVENVVADTLSRLPPLDIISAPTVYKDVIDKDEVTAVFSNSTSTDIGTDAVVFNVKQTNNEDVFLDTSNKIPYSRSTIQQMQRDDDSTNQVIKLKKMRNTLDRRQHRNQPVKIKQLLREWKRLYIGDDELLYRKTNQFKQLVVPEKLRNLIYKELHEEMGHLGPERAYQLARERFFWPCMEQDIAHYIGNVCPCVKRKAPHRRKEAELQSIQTSHPLELVGIDFLHLDKCCGGYEYLLVITDHFTRYCQAYPTRNKSARTAAERLFGDFMLRFSMPKHLLSDQGKEFDNELFKQLSQLAGVKQLHTTPYHPQCNGQTERMNATIISMLQRLPEQQKSKWKNYVNKVLFAYNCTKHDSTGFSPYHLLFGRKPRLPIDILLETETNGTRNKDHSVYLRQWEEQMKEAFTIA